MRSIFKLNYSLSITGWIISAIIAANNLYAQEVKYSDLKLDTLLSIAHDYIKGIHYCALITIDSTGNARARAMDPFPPEDDIVIWFATNRYSSKVNEIKNNPRVTIYYADENGIGYISIIGNAILVDDPKEKAVRWKEEWERFYVNQKESYILIKVVPEKLEILNFQHGIFGDKVTWRIPVIEFENNKQ